jgi:hypothetical protein
MEAIKRKAPPLRIAILGVMPHGWTTARELAQRIEGYEQSSIRNELGRMFADGLLLKRVEAIPPRGSSPRLSYYRLPEGVSNDTE